MHQINRPKVLCRSSLFSRIPLSRSTSTIPIGVPDSFQDTKPLSGSTHGKYTQIKTPLNRVVIEQSSIPYKPDLAYLKKRPNSFANRLAQATTMAKQATPSTKESSLRESISNTIPPMLSTPSPLPLTPRVDAAVERRRAERLVRESKPATSFSSPLPVAVEDPLIAKRRAERLARQSKATNDIEPPEHSGSPRQQAYINRPQRLNNVETLASGAVESTQDLEFVCQVEPPAYHGPDPVSVDLTDIFARKSTSAWDCSLNRAISDIQLTEGKGNQLNINRILRKYGADYSEYVDSLPEVHMTPLQKLQPTTQARLAITSSGDIPLNMRLHLVATIEKALGTIGHDT